MDKIVTEYTWDLDVAPTDSGDINVEFMDHSGPNAFEFSREAAIARRINYCA
ncbi:MAG TPA: hypothetical protein VEK34_13255 [Methylocella sp.]|nr:hypothetical protein [Methylocella sp.]